jgi:hypothetical protein
MPIRNLGAHGLIGEDQSRFSLPVGALKAANGVRCDGVNVRTFLQSKELFNSYGSASTSTSLQFEPSFFLPVQWIGSNPNPQLYFIYANNNNIYGAADASRKNNLTRTAAGADVIYSALTSTYDWTGEVIGGIPTLTNGKDSPQVQLTSSLTTRFQNIRWDDSAGTTWATRTAGAVQCLLLTSLERHWVAMNMVENGDYLVNRIRWSDPTLTNTQPTTWEDTRLDTVADYYDLDETPGEILDSKMLGRTRIVYKSDSIWAMDWVGGDSIFQFRRLFDFGPAGLFCVVSLGSTHVVLTPTDIIEHNGVSYSSLAHSKIRSELQENIALYNIQKLMWNEKKRELLACLGTYSYPFIYNYDAKTWSKGGGESLFTGAAYHDSLLSANNGKKIAFNNTSSRFYAFDDAQSTVATRTTSGSINVPLLLADRGQAKVADYMSLKRITKITPYYECSGSAHLTLALKAYHSPEYPTGRSAGTTMTLSQSNMWRLGLMGRDFDLGENLHGVGVVRLWGFDVEYEFVGET